MNVELLAPAGDYKSAIAAINAGADAVYLGGNMFGARANAHNLSTEEIIDIIEYAHIFNKKIYLTVNTLIKDKEIESNLFDFICPLYEKGLDAVIVQDIGVLIFIKQYFPQLHIHASTQMTILGTLTVEKLKKMGVSRIVTPRELSINEIKELADSTDIEIESFVHGALCYCYSGQCMFSSHIGNRSGNRGYCAGPCRMEYDVIKDNKVINPGNNKYILSPKDICTLKILPDIIEAGVYSLKIEGRMKKPEYVAGVVSIYRKYIDLYMKKPLKYSVDEQDIMSLSDLFNRNGFNESYYKQYNGKNMISLKKPDFRTENRELISCIKNKYVDNKLKLKLDIRVDLKRNDAISISSKIGDEEVKVYGDICLQAMTRPMDTDTVKKQISKLGNTYYEINAITVDMDDDIFVPIGSLNSLRRKFVEQITYNIVSKYYRQLPKDNIYLSEVYGNVSPHTQYSQLDTIGNVATDELYTNRKLVNGKIEISASVSNYKQLKVVLEYKNINRIYLEDFAVVPENINDLINALKIKNKKIFIAMPYIFRSKDKHIFYNKYKNFFEYIDGFLIRNFEEYFYLKNILVEKSYIFDYNVYAYNKISKNYYNCQNIMTTVPFELNYSELKKRGCGGEEMVVYGYIPSMISVGCALKSCDQCDRKGRIYDIKDRLNNVFKVRCVCDYCYNIMYNCRPLSLIGYSQKLNGFNLKSIRVSFTTENDEQIIKILDNTIEAFLYEKQINDNTHSTRGHFNRGVL